MKLCVFLWLTLMGSLALGAEKFGRVEAVEGEAYVTDDKGVSVALLSGHEVFEGQTVSTRAGTELHLATVDSGFMALRPNTTLRIDAFKSDGVNEKLFVSLFKGALRSITGWIGKQRRENYRLTTPTASIGIRGTDHETAVVELAQGRDLPGTYEAVYEGATVLTTVHGEVTVKAGQFAVALRDQAVAPALLADPPDFLKQRSLKLESRIQERKEVLREFIDKLADEVGDERLQKMKEAFREASPEQRERMVRKVRRKIQNRNN